MRTLVAAVALVLAAPAFAQDVSVETLRELGDRFDRAQIEGDRAALDAMTADDVILVGANGRRQNKADFIAGWTDPNVRFQPITVTDRYFTPLGPDVGVVGGDVILQGTMSGRPFTTRLRFADTFRRIDGVWRAVHIQATRVPPAPAASQ